MFISNSKPNTDRIISREIIDIKESKDSVTITCVEGFIDGKNKLYNILTNKEVKGYKSTDTLTKYQSKLNVISYTFEDDYLVNITK